MDAASIHIRKQRASMACVFVQKHKFMPLPLRALTVPNYINYNQSVA